MEMNNEDRNFILQFVIQHLKNDKLSYKALNAVAIKHVVHCRTVSRFWKQ